MVEMNLKFTQKVKGKVTQYLTFNKNVTDTISNPSISVGLLSGKNSKEFLALRSRTVMLGLNILSATFLLKVKYS